MKKLFSLVLCLFGIIGLASCDNGPQKLATPTNFVINNDVASWDAVENASKYRLNIVDESAKEFKRVVDGKTTADMTSFDLAVGVYNVYIQAVADKNGAYQDSDYTTEAVV